MARTNFTECGAIYENNQTLIDRYGWTGPVVAIEQNKTSTISREGCLAVCGVTPDYYPWAQSSSTITTWVLPSVGIFLQAPFESNASWATIRAICRWLGSPIASLSYVLWNIKVSGKCALLVDLAVPYNRPTWGSMEDERTQADHFESIRSSFYLLSVMNQYSMKNWSTLELQKEAEGLLRIVLFSKDLPLPRGMMSLDQYRRKLAKTIRAFRRRGVVPVYISMLWFFFSLAISIEDAFGHFGDNATAHDLALGFLLGWLPVLILCSIVDRNPIAADYIQAKLNKMINAVRESLRDDHIRDEYIATFQDQSEVEASRMQDWVEAINDASVFMDPEFFKHFAGQGRVRFHYGAAHPILSDIENSYIASQGRNWLDDEREARYKLVLGEAKLGLKWFDFREMWQIVAAVTTFAMTIAGAFALSYYTPTVGLGCRSGGYLIFGVMSFTLLFFEMVVWWIGSKVAGEMTEGLRRTTTRSERLTHVQQTTQKAIQRPTTALRSTGAIIWTLFEQAVLSTSAIIQGPQHTEGVKLWLEGSRQSLADLTFQQWASRCFFTPLEMVNTCWLIYIVLAQTFGWYRTCKCVTSTWGGRGGYLDFDQSDVTNNPWVKAYWTTGTVLGCSSMFFAMSYIVTEWCVQSHLSTSDLADAMAGLQRTRRFRYLTLPVRMTVRGMLSSIHWALKRSSELLGIKLRQQESVMWTRKNGAPSRGIRQPRRADTESEYRSSTAWRNDTNMSRQRSESDVPLIEVQRPEHAYAFGTPDSNMFESPEVGFDPPRMSRDRSLSGTREDFLSPLIRRPVYTQPSSDAGDSRGSSESEGPASPLGISFGEADGQRQQQRSV